MIIQNQNIVAQLRAKNGPYFDKWKAGVLKALNKTIPGVEPVTEQEEVKKEIKGALPDPPHYDIKGKSEQRRESKFYKGVFQEC